MKRAVVRRYPDIARDSRVYQAWARQAKCVFARALAQDLTEKRRQP